MSGLTTRERLIQRILQLPESSLPHVEQYLENLADTALSTGARGDDEPLASALCIGPRDWPHAPLHRLVDHGTYMVTAGTLHKEHIFRGTDRLDLLELNLLTNAKKFGWQLEAWAVFSNHYHFVAHALANAGELASFIKALHGESAVIINRFDGHPGRQVWHNYRDTELSYEKSYFARLNYVHHNAVKHGLVPVANQYRWCSAAWFERTATPAQVRTIYRFKTDKVKVPDDYEPLAP